MVFKTNKLLEGMPQFCKIAQSSQAALLPRNPHLPPAGGILFRKGKPHFYRVAASMERKKTIGLI